MLAQMHELNSFFEQDELNFREFYDDEHETKNRKKYRYKFDSKLNPFIKNELQWWLQHMREDNNSSGATLFGFCDGFIKHFSLLMIEKHPDIKSVAELPYDVIDKEHKDYLVNKGLQLKRKCGSKNHIDSDMEYRRYYAKSDNLYDFDRYYQYAHEFYYPDITPEKEKDIWDIRKLGIKFNNLPSRPRYTINYTNIEQIWLREKMKEYNFIRLPKQAVSTVLDDMKAFNLFSSFLTSYEGNVNCLKDIDRACIKAFVRLLRTKKFETTTFNRRLSAIKTFFDLGNIFEIDGFPTSNPIKEKDFVKRRRKMPVPFSDNELKQMNKYMNTMPYPFDSIFFIIERHGLRMSDLCSATIEVNGKYCIKKIKENDNLFTYYQVKSHKTNTINIDDVNVGIIESAIEFSRKTYGDNVKYIFSKNDKEPVGEESFTYHLNKMCKENNIVADSGKLLRVKGHTFRRTLATDYANMGIDLNVIKALLGQSKLDVLNHYIKIHSKEMAKYMEPITQENYDLIDSIGKEVSPVVEQKYKGDYLSLSCGYCSKDVKTGICEHANACYKCSMFVPDITKLPLYKKQLMDVELSIMVCKANGYERLLETNLELRDKLNNIIYELEAKDENGQNRRIIN